MRGSIYQRNSNISLPFLICKFYCKLLLLSFSSRILLIHIIVQLQGIPQPESAKSVKIVKTSEIIFKGCALLGYIESQDKDKAERWIGWYDTRILRIFEMLSHYTLHNIYSKRKEITLIYPGMTTQDY